MEGAQFCAGQGRLGKYWLEKSRYIEYNEIVGGFYMPYEVLEKQIRALPEEALQELSHYVGYLFSIYTSSSKKTSISSKVNDFMKSNPNAFDEFKPVQNAGLETIRELTKNDSW